MVEMDKKKIQLDLDVIQQLVKLKGYGETYSDVIRKLLKND